MSDDLRYAPFGSRPFTRAEALAAGYTPAEIRHLLQIGVWRRVRRGVYIQNPAPEEARGVVLDAGLALRTVVAPPFALSHRSAALLHHLDLLGRSAPLPVHVTVDRDAGRGTCAGAVLHRSRLRPDDIAMVDDVPVTILSRTVLDIARTSSFAAGVVVADCALRRGLSREELTAAAAELSRLRGGRAGVRVAGFANGLAEAPSESLLRVVCADAGVELHLQVNLYDADGFIGRVDAVVVGFFVVLEVDGMLKYDRPEILRREKMREDRLREAGWEVVRITWDDLLHHPERTMARIRAACARAAARRAA